MKVADAMAFLSTLSATAEVDVTLRDLGSAKTDAERARDYRLRKKDASRRHVTVRDGGGKGEVCLGSEKEAEKSGEETGNGSNLTGGSRGNVTAIVTASRDARRPKGWTRVPVEWQPNDAHCAIARERNVDFDLELSKFRDHDFARPKRDADATFRNWLRNAQPSRTSVTHYKSAGTLQLERAARLAEEQRKALA